MDGGEERQQHLGKEDAKSKRSSHYFMDKGGDASAGPASIQGSLKHGSFPAAPGGRPVDFTQFRRD